MEYFSKLCETLNIIIPGNAVEEYRLLKFETLPTLEKTDRIDNYWITFFEKAEKNVEKYKNVKSIFLAACCLSHGNASVERGFSVLN
mgnify:CR=1 FL=1